MDGQSPKGLGNKPNIEDIVGSVNPSEIDRWDSRRNWEKKLIELVRLCSDFYFKPKSFERNLRVYERLGVRFFKKYLLPYGDVMVKYVLRPLGFKLVKKSSPSLDQYEITTRILEGFHLGGLAAFTYGMVEYGPEIPLAGHLVLHALNVLINIYPIITQRYNRARVYKLLEKDDLILHKIKEK